MFSMRGKTGTPTGKRSRDVSYPNPAGKSAMKRVFKDQSMTPDTFERSQLMKKKGLRRRHSLNESYDGDITQMVGNYTQLSDVDDSMMQTDLERTPETLSQISAINPNENDTFTTTFAQKRGNKGRADETWEMAVVYARGEPDGAERSFTRKNLSKMSLNDDGDGDDLNENDISNEIEMDDDEGPSPVKRAKMNIEETPTTKEKKGSLKIPLKQAAKKMKFMKNRNQVRKAKKQVNKNFEALPDETTVPKTPNQTWKEKKKDRKMMKNNYELIVSAKKHWEELRRGNLPAEKRHKICEDLMQMVEGKVKELSMVHDSSRVVQCLVQYGNDAQRQTVFEEIRKDIPEICKSRYAKFVIRKLIHYGSKARRGEVMSCFHGHVRKLIRHKEASEIIEYAFNEYATAPQRQAFLEEFYGPSFFLFKDPTHQTLEQIMTDMPEKREMILRSMKETLTPLINKELISYSVVHKIFFDYFTYADESAKKEVIEGVREYIPHLLHTRDGTRVAMHCVWSGSAKDRKTIVKSLKTHVLKVCKEEHGHLCLLSIFDSVDDTVLVQKIIIEEILKSLNDVVNDAHGRKVLLYLLSSRDLSHFHPDVIKILSQGDGNAHSKKDKHVRAKELKIAVSSSLLKYLEDNAESMMINTGMALLTKAIISHATGDAGPAMRAIADFIAKPTTDETINIVENPACHIAMKKIIANDKTRMEQGEGILFSAVLLEAVPKSAIKIWAASNRGCFILLSLLEVGCSTVTERVTEQLKPLQKSLSKMTFKGAELLIEKLENPNTGKKREFRV